MSLRCSSPCSPSPPALHTAGLYTRPWRARGPKDKAGSPHHPPRPSRSPHKGSTPAPVERRYWSGRTKRFLELLLCASRHLLLDLEPVPILLGSAFPSVQSEGDPGFPSNCHTGNSLQGETPGTCQEEDQDTCCQRPGPLILPQVASAHCIEGNLRQKGSNFVLTE